MDINDLTWNPWHGCHKCSEGCQNCYAFFMDKRYGRDTSHVTLNASNIDLPVKKDKEGNWKLPSGSFVRVCMTSDFFLEEADEWRDETWSYIRRRPDVTFSLLTKRADRIMSHLPRGWGEGWDNVQFAVSAENQKRVDERIPYLLEVPSKHKWISVKPFIGEVDLDRDLASGQIETVLAGGENYMGSRPLHYDWVKKVHDQCEAHGVRLIFGQTGNVFIKEGKEYKIRNRTDQMIQALKSGLHYPAVDIDAEIAKVMERKERMKATPFLAIYSFILIWLYVKDANYALFLVWMQVPLYWAHEFEEYVCPGGFLKFFNMKPLGSKQKAYPLTKAGSFWINIPLVYVLLPLAAIASHFWGIEWGLWTAYFSALNAAAHIVMFFIFGRRYNPGLVMSTFVNVPFGIYMVWHFLSNGLVSPTVNIISIIVGIVAQASMMVYGFAYLVPKMKREQAA